MQEISDAEQMLAIPANTDNEYPLIFRSGDSVTFFHKISKEKFRQMATALLQEMDREDECLKDESNPNSQPIENPKKCFLDNVSSYTDADNSQVICDSFREDNKDSIKISRPSGKRVESLTCLELEISRCETLPENSEVTVVAYQNSLCESNIGKSEDSLGCQSELNRKLVDGPDNLSTTSEVDSEVTNERIEDFNTITGKDCNNLTHNDQGIANNEDICNTSKTSTGFHIRSKNLEKNFPEPSPKSSGNTTIGFCNVDIKSLGEAVGERSKMQEADGTENENYDRLPSISTGDCLESAWHELGSFTKIEAIPTTEISSHISPNAVTKYLKLEVIPNEYIIVGISANLKNVFVNVFKAREISSTPIATETAITVNGSDVHEDTDLNGNIQFKTWEYSEEQARLDSLVKRCEINENTSIPKISQVQLGPKHEDTTGTQQLTVDSSGCDSINASILPSTMTNSSFVSDNITDERFITNDRNRTLKNISIRNTDEMDNSGNSETAMSSPELKMELKQEDVKMNENTVINGKEKDFEMSYSFDTAVFESSSIKNGGKFIADIEENSEEESVDDISITKLAKECSPIKYIPPVETRKSESIEHKENRNEATSILNPKGVSCENSCTEEKLKDQYVKSAETFKSEVSEKSLQKLALEVSANKSIKSSVTEEKLIQTLKIESRNESYGFANEQKSTEIIGMISEENEVINESLSESVDVDKHMLKDSRIEINSYKKVADVSMESLTEATIKEIKGSSPKEASISPEETDVSTESLTEATIKEIKGSSPKEASISLEETDVSTERVTKVVLEETSDRLLNETSTINESDEEVRRSSLQLNVAPSNQSSTEKTLGDAENTLVEGINFEKDDDLLDVSVKKNIENKEGSFLEVEKIEMNSSNKVEFKIEQKCSKACDSSDKPESASNIEMGEECSSTENVDSEYEVDEEINEECGAPKNTEFEDEVAEKIDVNNCSRGNTESEDGDIDEVADKSLSEMVESEDEVNEEIGAKLDLYFKSRKVDRTMKGRSQLVKTVPTKDVFSEKKVSGNATSSTKAFAHTIKSEQKKSRVAEKKVHEDSSCENTESELGDDSFYINTKMREEFSEDEAREKPQVTDQSSSAENEGVTETTSEGDTTENEDCKSVESLDDSKDSKARKAASRYRLNRGKKIKDEVDSAPTRTKRHVASKLYQEVIPEHSAVTRSSKTNSKTGKGTSHAETSSVATPKSFRSTSVENVQNKKLSLRKMNSVATELSSESGNALTRKKRAQTPEVKFKTDIKVAVRSSPRKFDKTVSGETSTVAVSRSAASTSKTTGKTRSGEDSVSHVSTRRTKRGN